MRGVGLRASFRKKLLGSFLAVGLVPLVVCVGLILGIFQTVLLRNSMESAQSQIEALTSDLGGLIASCGDVLEELGREELILRAMTGRGRGNGTQVYNALYSAAAPLLREADFALYDAEGKLLMQFPMPCPEAFLPTGGSWRRPGKRRGWSAGGRTPAGAVCAWFRPFPAKRGRRAM